MNAKITANKTDTYKGHRDCIYALEGGIEHGSFFSSGSDGLVVKWNLAEPDKGTLLAEIPSSVYALRLHKERKRLLAGKNFEGLLVIDLASSEVEKALQITQSAVYDLALTGDLYWVASGEGMLQAIHANSFELVFARKLSEKSARTLAVSPDGKWLAVGFSDFQIRVLNLQTGNLAYEWQAHENSVFSLAFSPDGRFLVSGSRDAHLKVWDVEAGFQLQKDVAAHMFAINAIAYHPTLPYLATGSMDKSVKIWDAVEFRLLKVLDKARHAGHATSVNKLYWEPTHEKLLTCSDDRTIGVWDIQF
jgi:WD40 repeat protein